MKGERMTEITTMYRCENCGRRENDPPLAALLHERLDDGGTYTDRECSNCGALTYLESVDQTKRRLEYLRACLRAESMSYGELAELQGLAPFIEPGDVELLEAAGVPEFPDDEDDCGASETAKRPDFRAFDSGSLVILMPMNQAGRDWLKGNGLTVEDNPELQTWCGGIVVEPRYIGDIIEGIRGDGLEVA